MTGYYIKCNSGLKLAKMQHTLPFLLKYSIEILYNIKLLHKQKTKLGFQNNPNLPLNLVFVDSIYQTLFMILTLSQVINKNGDKWNGMISSLFSSFKKNRTNSSIYYLFLN